MTTPTPARFTVATTTGDTTDLTIPELFTRADDITLATGHPALDAAATRVLLAVVYTALGAPTDDDYLTGNPLTRDRLNQVAAWAHEHADLFDLHHPDHPFLQDPTLDGQPTVHPQLLDPTLAKKRPLLSDHRTAADTRPLTPVEATLLLVDIHTYIAGGKHSGVSASMKTGTLTNQTVFYPRGTLADTLSWWWIPTFTPGTAHFTWPGPHDCTGDADGLTWHTRRLLLAPSPDGTISEIVHTHGLPAPAVTVADDHRAGRAAVATATDTTKPLVGSTNRSMPEIAAAWARATEGSFAWWAARTTRPLPPITVTGTAMSQSKWLARVATDIDPAFLTLDPDTATALPDTRKKVREKVWGPWDVDFDTVLTGTVTSDDAIDTLTGVTDQRRPRPARPAYTLADTPEPATSVGDTTDDPLGLFTTAAPTTAVTNVCAFAERLARTDPDWAARVATAVTTRIPVPADLAPVVARTDAERLTVALIAYWVHTTGQRGGNTPLPTRLHRTGGSGQDLLDLIVNTPTLTGARPLLVDALTMLPPTRVGPHWPTLLRDLTSWDPATRRAWLRDAPYLTTTK